MTVEELIALGPTKVRRDKELMRRYIDLFTASFGSTPECAGCTFNRDWNRFKSGAGAKKMVKLQSKSNTMEYKLHNRHRAEILTYIKNGRPMRTYGRTITDEFAKEYLSNGTPEQLAARRKMFSQVPGKEAKKAPEPKMKTVADLINMKRSELDKLAKLRGMDPGDFPNKSVLIKALKSE